LALALAVALGLASVPAVAATRYIFAVFKGDSTDQEKLSIYTSADGLNFKLLADTGYGGPTGVLRDPSIMRHRDGKYYVAHTLQSWDTRSAAFAIASSVDLVKWTSVATVDAQVADVAHTWAPEWFKDSDGSINLIVNIDTSAAEWSFRAYKFTATDDTLTKWGGPTTIGIGPNYIDTFIVRSGSTYHAFSKNETTKYIEHATAASLNGPWTWVGKDDWAGWGSGKEGPALFQLASGEWRIVMDKYSGGGCLHASSSDLNKWSATSEIPGGLSGVVRHGTVLREDDLPDGGGGDSAAADVAVDRAAPEARSDGRADLDASGDGSNTGGANGSGGRSGTGGMTGRTGGAPGSGGASSKGGTSGSGGSSRSGGSAGGSKGSSGGATASGGAAGSAPGSGGTTADAAVGDPRDSSGDSGCTCGLGSPVSRKTWLAMLLLLALLVRRKK
jgi:hypothetical protein